MDVDESKPHDPSPKNAKEAVSAMNQNHAFWFTIQKAKAIRPFDKIISSLSSANFSGETRADARDFVPRRR